MRVGHVIFGLTMATTINLFLLSKPNLAQLPSDPWLTWSQGAGLTGTMMLAWTYILSSRLPFLENWFGPYDKIFRFHHRLGGLAFILLSSHPVALAIRSLPDTERALSYLWPINNWVWLAGWFGLMALVGLLFLTIGVKLPYGRWKFSHQFMGVVLIAAGIHIFFISSDVARFWPLKVWMMGWLAAAMIGYGYLKLIYPRWGPKFKYLVDQVRIGRGVAEVELRPTEAKIKFRGGQFVFLRIDDGEIGSEEHPFSIAGREGDKIKLAIKMVGDYTSGLDRLKKGTEVVIRGPYGELGKMFTYDQGVVLIAGGIGITPMMGMMDDEKTDQ